MTPDDFFKRIEAHRDELAIAGVRRLGVYGSVARGEARSDSDVDVLVEFDKTPDLFEFAACGIAWSKFSDDPWISRRRRD
jgi:predicted nucleotidyltransferase